MGELLAENLEKHTSKFLCPICKDPLSVPQSIIKCKHTFCYSCLKNWFINSIKNSNLRCPLCREIVDEEPFNNKILQSVIISFFNLFCENEKQQSYFERLGTEKREFEVDLKNKKLFEENFKTTGVGIVDMDDGGVLRCSSCHWEIEMGGDDEDETECPHCGVAFRGVDQDELRRRRREAGNNSDDDGESINTDGERSDVGEISAEENSDLDGFIIDELGESEQGSESESAFDSDYYEFNSGDEDVQGGKVSKNKRRKRVTVEISDDDDVVVIETKQEEEYVGGTSRKKRGTVIDDEEDE